MNLENLKEVTESQRLNFLATYPLRFSHTEPSKYVMAQVDSNGKTIAAVHYYTPKQYFILNEEKGQS